VTGDLLAQLRHRLARAAGEDVQLGAPFQGVR
jgi:hypothetical protein